MLVSACSQSVNKRFISKTVIQAIQEAYSYGQLSEQLRPQQRSLPCAQSISWSYALPRNIRYFHGLS